LSSQERSEGIDLEALYPLRVRVYELWYYTTMVLLA
jgi:hypothetical protein